MKFIFLVLAFVLASCAGNSFNNCQPQPVADAGPDQNLILGLGLPKFVGVGSTAAAGSTYMWSPAEGLSDPAVAQPYAFPRKTTEYKVTAVNKCGATSDSVTVTVYAEDVIPPEEKK